MNIFSLAITLFFVLDPFGNLPVVLSLLSNYDKKTKIKIVIRESFIAFFILFFFYFLGPSFISLLQIGPSDLNICGGVVLGIIALKMIFPDDSSNKLVDKDKEPFIVPLAIPLMVGPSALATVIIIAAQSYDNLFSGFFMVSLAWLVSSVLLLIGISASSFFSQRILSALERLAGLLLAVIAVRMLMTGIRDYFLI